MKISGFEIENFKGVTKTRVWLSSKNPGNIITLIGLNESGKTTILEALSYFITEDKDTAQLVQTVREKSAIQDLIPKDRKGAFSGSITIRAWIQIEDDDKEALRVLFKNKYNLELDLEKMDGSSIVESVYKFVDSDFKGHGNLWSIGFHLKKPRAKKYAFYQNNKPSEEDRDIWLAGIELIKERIPKIVYFPTLLFDFPERIYLESAPDDSLNEYYKQVIQDVLDSQGDGLSIDKHIVNRINNVRKTHNSASTFMSMLFGRDEKKQIDAILHKASNQMTQVIFGAWNDILGRNVRGKRVQIDWLLDVGKSNAPYLEVYILDGEAKYSLSERSLGFRWFFSFLLFTQFRKNRVGSGSTIFVFDEPAANLHSKAQTRLLESFARIATGGTYIVFSTHSHYMINPLWLEKAYIVQNKATDYEDDINDFSLRKTDIDAILYKTFVGSYPSKFTYFQPVLDALDVSFSPLVRSANAIIVEGKYDYYPLVYFRKCLTAALAPEIFPCGGAGNASTLINLFRGWGVKFRVLLDDDQAGKTAKLKYIQELLLKEEEVLTLGDIDPLFNGKSFEGAIYKDDFRRTVSEHFKVDKIKKDHFSLYLQGLICSKTQMSFADTEAAFKPISNWIDAAFA